MISIAVSHRLLSLFFVNKFYCHRVSNSIAEACLVSMQRVHSTQPIKVRDASKQKFIELYLDVLSCCTYNDELYLNAHAMKSQLPEC